MVSVLFQERAQRKSYNRTHARHKHQPIIMRRSNLLIARTQPNVAGGPGLTHTHTPGGGHIANKTHTHWNLIFRKIIIHSITLDYKPHGNNPEHTLGSIILSINPQPRDDDDGAVR